MIEDIAVESSWFLQSISARRRDLPRWHANFWHSCGIRLIMIGNRDNSKKMKFLFHWAPGKKHRIEFDGAKEFLKHRLNCTWDQDYKPCYIPDDAQPTDYFLVLDEFVELEFWLFLFFAWFCRRGIRSAFIAAVLLIPRKKDSNEKDL